METTDKYIAIPNLKNKLEEAIFDAINFFNKKCPYCDKELFSGNIRQKIEVDHFIPVHHGGQDVPWNILPSCKSCNRKKKTKLPEIFLKTDKLVKCTLYLEKVKRKHTHEIQDDLERFERIKAYLVNYKEQDKEKTLFPLYEILGIEYKLEAEQKQNIFSIANSPAVKIIQEYFDVPKNDNEITKVYTATQLKSIFEKKFNINISIVWIGKLFSKLGFRRKQIIVGKYPAYHWCVVERKNIV